LLKVCRLVGKGICLMKICMSPLFSAVGASNSGTKVLQIYEICKFLY
jgi:hypothetical protein